MEYIDADDEKGLRDENVIDSEYVDLDEEDFDSEESRTDTTEAAFDEQLLSKPLADKKRVRSSSVLPKVTLLAF